MTQSTSDRRHLRPCSIPRKHLVLVTLILANISIFSCQEHKHEAEMTWRIREQYKNKVKNMFRHGYESYMRLAFPNDDLRPITCDGHNTWGSYSLTLIDSLDTLLVLGDEPEFKRQVKWVIKNISFDKDLNVSVFETNIRVLGGLLSTHLLIEKSYPKRLFKPHEYKGELLKMAVDLGDRLLPAFNTSTGIPYGTVNLRHGVPPKEIEITCTAGAGTFSLEFGVLSALTGNKKYENAAKAAVKGIWDQRSKDGLIGNHINIQTGQWTYGDAGIGHGIDSYYEYLLKAAILFDDGEYWQLFQEAYAAVMKKLKRGPFYVEASLQTGAPIWSLFNNLQAFWPGMQVLYGDLQNATFSTRAFHQIWRQLTFNPEKLDLPTGRPLSNQASYPLRPELAESIYMLSQAYPKSAEWLYYAKDLVDSIETFAKTDCGYAAIKNILDHSHMNRMDSFFLAETCKYLYLTFDQGNFVNQGNFIFNTEAHPFPIQKRFFQSQRSNWSEPFCLAVNLSPKIFPDPSLYNMCSRYNDALMLDTEKGVLTGKSLYSHTFSLARNLHTGTIIDLLPLPISSDDSRTAEQAKVEDLTLFLNPPTKSLKTTELKPTRNTIETAAVTVEEIDITANVKQNSQEVIEVAMPELVLTLPSDFFRDFIQQKLPGNLGQRNEDETDEEEFREFQEFQEWKQFQEWKEFKKFRRWKNSEGAKRDADSEEMWNSFTSYQRWKKESKEVQQ